MKFLLPDGSEVTMTVTDASVRYDREARKTRVYISEEGESIMDNLMNRRSRPHQYYKKLIPEGLDFLLQNSPKDCKENGITKDSIQKASWSQKAGCNCGCSPGFIITGSEYRAIWFTVKTTVKKHRYQNGTN